MSRATRVRAVLDEVLAALAAPVASVNAVEVRAGAVNDIVKLHLEGVEQPLALRCRRILFARVADSRLAKDAVCAHLTLKGREGPIAPALLDQFLVSEVGGDLEFEFAAHVHMYRHAPTVQGPGPWSLSDWIDGQSLLEAPTEQGFRWLGATLARLHLTRFAAFAPDLDQPGRYRQWRDWYADLISFFAQELLQTPGFEGLGVRLCGLPRPPEPAALVLTHGDLHPANVLVTLQGVRLIDWDEAQIGPPEFDFPILRYRAVQGAEGRLVAAPALFDALVQGYHAAGGRLDATLLAYAEVLYLVKQLKISRIKSDSDLSSEVILSNIAALLNQLEVARRGPVSSQ